MWWFVSWRERRKGGGDASLGASERGWSMLNIRVGTNGVQVNAEFDTVHQVSGVHRTGRAALRLSPLMYDKRMIHPRGFNHLLRRHCP